MRLYPQGDKEVAGWASACAFSALPGESNLGSVIRATRNRYLERASAFELQGDLAPPHYVEKVDPDLGFGVGPLARPPAVPKTLSETSQSAEQVFDIDFGRESVVGRAALGTLLPMLVGTSLVGVEAGFQSTSAEFVVELALFLVPDDIVGVGDFLETLSRLGVVGVDVGMVLSRELSVRFADFVLARSLLDTKGFVEIFFGHYLKSNAELANVSRVGVIFASLGPVTLRRIDPRMRPAAVKRSRIWTARIKPTAKAARMAVTLAAMTSTKIVTASAISMGRDSVAKAPRTQRSWGVVAKPWQRRTRGSVVGRSKTRVPMSQSRVPGKSQLMYCQARTSGNSPQVRDSGLAAICAAAAIATTTAAWGVAAGSFAISW